MAQSIVILPLRLACMLSRAISLLRETYARYAKSLARSTFRTWILLRTTDRQAMDMTKKQIPVIEQVFVVVGSLNETDDAN